MKDMTKANVEAVFAGESQAHMKYAAFADMAERESLRMSRCFLGAALFAEQAHATNHLRVLAGIGKTLANLEAAYAGETFEINEMYPAYIDVAKMQEEERGLGQHGRRPGCREGAPGALCEGQRSGGRRQGRGGGCRLGVGSVCGFTGEGEPPEKCPVCGAVHTKLQKF